MICVNVADGKEVWRKNFGKDFGGKMMSQWGFSESPLIDGDKVVVTPGAADAMIVALNKKTGALIWKSAQPDIGSKGKDGAAYSSIVIGQCAGVKQYITLTGRGVIGVRAEDGKFLWGYNKAINNVANITSPVVKGDTVFASSAYGTGSALLKLSADGQGGVKAEEVYFLDAKTFANHHGGVVLVGDYLYGGTGQNAGLPVCIEMATGKIVWKAPKAEAGGSAAVLYADGNVIFRYEKDAVVALIAATPDGYKLQGTFKAAASDGPSWAHPVIQDGKLYLRSHDTLMCYNVSAK
jgi:outer membrane protein assembly factor BamB